MSLLKSISQGAMAFLCTVSLWNVPSYTYADCCQQDICCPQDDCCEGGGWWSGGTGRNVLILGGAAAVGAIAGAIAGNAAGGGRGHRGEDGRRGPRGFTGDPGPIGLTGPTGATGPAGPGAFTPDPDPTNTLTFSSVLTAGLEALTTGTITVVPFAVAPDGTMTLGTIQTIPAGVLAISLGLGGELTVGPLAALDFGDYEYGVQIIPNGFNLVFTSANLIASATASRGGGSVTQIGIPNLLGLGFTILGGQQIQIAQTFNYNASPVPTP